MGGSGSGSGMGIYGQGGSGGGRSCADLIFEAEVQSPSPPSVTVGDVFDVRLDPQGPGIYVVEVVDGAGRVIGSIIDHLDDLIPCLQQGTDYGAVVQRIAASGRPVVRVSAR